MTEQISLTFNSDKYPDGTIRNQFKINIQSQSCPINKEDDDIEYPKNEPNRRFPNLSSKEMELLLELLRREKNF